MKWIKNLFKTEKLEKLTCGSINTTTGEFFQGYRNENGEIVYRSEGIHSVWDKPEYIGYITQWEEHGYIWSDKTCRQEWKRPLYKETNLYNDTKKYFYITKDGIHQYIVSEAFEKDNQIIIV